MTTKPAHRSPPYLSPKDYGTTDLREHYRHASAAAADLATLARVVNSQPPDYAPDERGYVSLNDIVGDLGLSPQQRDAAKEAIKRMVADTRAAYAVAHELHDMGIEDTLVPVLLKRGMKLAQEARTSGRNVFKSAPAGAGWEPIPKGKKGGYRRHKAGGGFEYAYPDGDGGFTTAHEPHAGEHPDVHEDHEISTPKADVAEAFAQVAKRAKALGMNVDAHPTSKTTMKDVKALDALVTRHEKARKKKPAAGSDDADGKPPSPEPEPEDKPKPKPDLVTPSGDDEDEDEEPEGDGGASEGALKLVEEITALGKKKGIPQDKIDSAVEFAGQDETELATIRDYLKEMDDYDPGENGGTVEEAGDGEGADAEAGTSDPADPGTDTIPGLGHNVPTSPHELAALRNHVKALEQALDTMAKHLDRHERALHRRLVEDARRVRQNPSPEAVGWMTTRTRAFAMLVLGASAGLILGGPMGALLGLSLAEAHAKQTAHMPTAFEVGAGRVAGKIAGKVKAAAARRQARGAQTPGWDEAAQEEQERQQREREKKADEWLRQGAKPDGDAPVVKSLTVRLRRTPAWGDLLLVDGQVVALMPQPRSLLKARPRPVIDLIKSQPVDLPPPPPLDDNPIVAGPSNPYGLVAGQTLYVRKGEAWDTCPEVEVLPHGQFAWNGERYVNGTALLKALTGRERPGTTIRRYFRLGDSHAQLLKAVAAGLEARYAGLSFAAHGGAVRVHGDLAACNFPGARPGQRAMLLTDTDATSLLEHDNG